MDKVMNSLNGGPLVTEGANMQYLGTQPLREALYPQSARPWQRLFFYHLGNGCMKGLGTDEIRLHDHHGPFPLGLVVSNKGRHVFGPSEALQGHNGIIYLLCPPLHHELRGI